MTLFLPGPFPENEARQFYDRFVAERQARLVWFEAELAAAGISSDRTAACLGPITTFVINSRSVEQPADPPLWWVDQFSGYGWSHYGGALADGVVSLVAEIYRSEFDTGWEYRNSDPTDADHQRPVMSIATLTPPWQLVSILVQIGRSKAPADRLMQVVGNVIDHTRAMGAPRPGPDPDPEPDEEPHWLEVTIEPSRTSNFTWELWVDECAEMELGQQAFDRLWEQFEALPGVERVVHEDRELFLIAAPTVGELSLQSKCEAIVNRRPQPPDA